MKNLFLSTSLCLIFSLSTSAQSKGNQFLINQKLDSKFKNEIVFIKLINDSRCPEKTQCVWEGEVSFEVAAYRNKKLIEKKQFTLNDTNYKEIKEWFTKYSPIRKNAIIGINIYPYPKEGVQTTLKDYYIELLY